MCAYGVQSLTDRSTRNFTACIVRNKKKIKIAEDRVFIYDAYLSACNVPK